VFEAFCKDKLGPLALRLALGAVYVWHGYLKIMATGGMSWYPTWPVGWQLLIAWGEFAAGLAILLGFYCRWAAGAALVLTAGVLTCWQGLHVEHWPWRSLEPTLVLLMGALALLFLGAGELSLDGRGAGNAAPAKAPKKSK
jgi:uncharacterized membrane protein YphA (DoxX/SURF4 family)